MDKYLLTSDTFFHGKLIVAQHGDGYRFSIDAVLLAHHVKPNEGDRVLDLGAGCGIVALLLGYRYPSIQLYGIELQEELARVAELNARKNGMENRFKVLCQDLKHVLPAMLAGPVDMIVCNPPFRKLDSGRINPHPQKALARHEISVTLTDVLRTAGRLLRKKGRLVMVYLPERLVDLVCHMRREGIEPKYMRMIHSRPAGEAKLVLIQGCKGGRPGMKTGPPLVIYEKDGSYSKEVMGMFAA